MIAKYSKDDHHHARIKKNYRNLMLSSLTRNITNKKCMHGVPYLTLFALRVCLVRGFGGKERGGEVIF
jgi:hypothetical protein